ncbi:hypothetical protein ANCCAN_14676 [Ancylostoma caninum]|uniref:Uncharacterized protein n=1 Tax=Ancylostoma caninum TaxID=29170 RepID=A0A368G6T8_ANCCA|nr:hypothetical protein ANCCAN_14676 [Ancylostoma caninum]
MTYRKKTILVQSLLDQLKLRSYSSDCELYQRHPLLGILRKPVLTDVILLELIDSSATTLSDFYTLQLTGFVHHVEANGTEYWARGTTFCDVELMSACMIEAAVTVRAIALNSARQHRKIVSCMETISKWLAVMGLDKKGFRCTTSSAAVE